MILTYIAPQAA